MRKIIIDCDPGHDDAVAIMLAYANSDKLDLLAITTACGNNTLEKVTRNAGLITAICRERTPIYQGALRPLVGEPIISSEYHGETGMDGPINLPEANLPCTSHCAVEIMRDLLVKSKDPITVVALAPLTNIALLIRTYPELASQIECISLMGGGTEHGNITLHAEFNIGVDPEAAEIVFSSGIPVVMCGLDVTEKALMYPSEFEYLRNNGNVGRFFCELMDFYSRKSTELFGVDGCMMHDPCPVAYLLAPDLFSGIPGRVQVVLSGEKRGKTEFYPDKSGKTLMLNDVHRAAFRDIILKSIELLK